MMGEHQGPAVTLLTHTVVHMVADNVYALI